MWTPDLFLQPQYKGSWGRLVTRGTTALQGAPPKSRVSKIDSGLNHLHQALGDRGGGRRDIYIYIAAFPPLISLHNISPFERQWQILAFAFLP